MRRALGDRIALLATIVNAVAWFMPAYQEPSYDRFPAGPMLMGWQAFKASLLDSSLAARISFREGPLGIVTLTSPLTNFVFIVALGLLFRGRDRLPRTSRRLEAVVWLCFVLNCSWLVFARPSFFHEGYYVWLGSFAMLALALRDRRVKDLTASLGSRR
jgi:hypothetical protein